MLTFPSACEGAGGDIHGVQHDLHRALRVPQAVTTAWFATPPCPHVGGSVKLLFPSTGHLRILLDLIFYSFSKRLAHSPFPLPCTYILANSIQDTLCFSIALSMTVYSEPYDSGQRVKSVNVVPLQIQRHLVVISLPSHHHNTHSRLKVSPPTAGLPHPQRSLTHPHILGHTAPPAQARGALHFSKAKKRGIKGLLYIFNDREGAT